ncbi:MAG: hypothetical protein GQ570_11835 [Helicobacteraceae bacterium]|nr:hypothetical protein [Helicobacteraceae bacterium]
MAIVLREDKGAALTHAEHDTNFSELDKLPNGKTFPKEAPIGIKLDIDNPDFGWQDIEGYLLNYPDSPAPASANLYRGGIRSLQFGEGDEAFVNFHMPHDYAVGTPIYIHIHWSHNSSIVTGGSCTWAFELMYAKGYDQDAFKAPVTIAIVQDASIVPYQHMIAETIASDNGGSAVTIDTNLLEVDGIFNCRLYLDSNDITTSNASTVEPFAHFVDIHYQSNALPTIGRNFPFYGE